MPQKKNSISANSAWEKLIDKYHILEEIQKMGVIILRRVR